MPEKELTSLPRTMRESIMHWPIDLPALGLLGLLTSEKQGSGEVTDDWGSGLTCPFRSSTVCVVVNCCYLTLHLLKE
jgi:hypothetical protein